MRQNVPERVRSAVQCTLAATVQNEVGSFEGTTRGGHITGLGVGFCPIFGVVLPVLGTESRF